MHDGTAVTFQPNDVYIVFVSATPEEAAAILSEACAPATSPSRRCRPG